MECKSKAFQLALHLLDFYEEIISKSKKTDVKYALSLPEAKLFG